MSANDYSPAKAAIADPNMVYHFQIRPDMYRGTVVSCGLLR